MAGIGFLVFIVGITAYGRYQVIYEQYQVCISDSSCQSFDCNGGNGPPRIGHCPPYADPTMWWQIGIGAPVLTIGMILVIRSAVYRPTSSLPDSLQPS